jgi:hypothetical protein
MNEEIVVRLSDPENIEANVLDVNYIPGYEVAEQQRRANEVVRQSNETDRIALYEDMENKLETGYFDGEDGVGLNYNWSGTQLGVKREDESTYEYTDLKGAKGDDGVSPTASVTQGTGSATITVTDATGTTTAVLYDGEKGDKGDKGDPGAIKFTVVQELPATGDDDTIYLVPITPDTSGNNYAEYIYVNGNWELLGKIGVLQDLTNYVQFTDYASPSTAGVIKSSPTTYSTEMTSGGVLRGTTILYSSYDSTNDKAFISKGTLENVITGKDLTTKAYVDGLVGDIATAIDEIQGEIV